MSTTQLKPCPFCGHTPEADLYMETQGAKWGAIFCGFCCAYGPEVRTNYKPWSEWQGMAIEEWNNRKAAQTKEIARLRFFTNECDKEYDRVLRPYGNNFQAVADEIARLQEELEDVAGGGSLVMRQAKTVRALLQDKADQTKELERLREALKQVQAHTLDADTWTLCAEGLQEKEEKL